MAEQCISGGCTKEGKPCPACGGDVPPSRGVKPRRFCSSECCRQYHRPRLAGSPHCADCGCSITQPPGKGRKRAVCAECKAARKRRAMSVICISCGKPFSSSTRNAMFCSAGCRWRRRPAVVKCAACEKPFQQKHSMQKCCSRECGVVSGARSRIPIRRGFQCQHCGVPFHRRPYRTANKYCSRECAFGAKRLSSGGSAFAQLLSWFDNWGADALPAVASRGTNHKARCRRFGVPYEPVDRDRVFRDAEWKCAICGCEMLRQHTVIDGRLDPRSPTIDCIIPLAAGPGTPGYVEGNVQACCHACNVRKSDSFAPSNATSLD